MTVPMPQAQVPSQTPIPPSVASQQGLQVRNPDAFQWVLAWAVLIVVLALLNKSRVGHTVIYYALLLVVITLVLSNYRFIVSALSPFNLLTSQQ